MSPRKNRPSVLFAGALFVALLLLALPGQPTSTASAHRYAQSQISLQPQIVQPQIVQPQVVQPQAATAPDGLRAVVVELAAPAVVDIYAEMTNAPLRAASAEAIAAATRAQLAHVEAEQQNLLDQLAAYDAEIIYQAQRVYNGVAVRVPADQVATIATLPGVKSVRPLVAKRPASNLASNPAHDVSVPFIGAPALWGGAEDLVAAGITGEGITIAVVDTGVDYLHADFGGPASGYDDNDPTRIDDGVPWPTAKVIGGYDLTGNSYNADYEEFDPNPARNGYQPVPQPDSDPFDCYQHGTHVAGTAAGFGVTSNGETYRGPYDASLEGKDFRIAPGVAPQAKIYAIKVFGCQGSSEVVDLGVEWALDPNGDGDLSDRADVINLSLGANYGLADDSTDLAVRNAIKAGSIVVASAGNSGDVTFVAGTPGVVEEAISVAAMVDDPIARGIFPGTGSDFQTLTTFSSRGPRRGDGLLKPDVAAPGLQIVSAAHGTGNGARSLSGTSMAAPHVSGAAALLRQLYPTWSPIEIKALLMNSARPTIRTGFDDNAALETPSFAGAGFIDLANAARTPALAFDADRPSLVSLSFGAPAVSDSLALTRTVRLVDRRPTAAAKAELNYEVEYLEVATLPGVEIVPPASPQLTLPPGGAITFDIGLRVDAAQLAQVDSVVLDRGSGVPLYRLPEVAGYLQLRPLLPPDVPPTDDPVLTLPVHAAPRPVSILRATTDALDFGRAASDLRPLQIGIASAPGEPGTLPPAPVPPPASSGLTSAFDLLWQRPGGTRTRYAHADITHVGVTSRVQPSGERILYFAIATRAPWSTPNEVRFDLYIDADRDGTAEQILFNSDARGFNNRFETSDLLVSALEEIATERKQRELPLNALPFEQAPLETNPFFSNVLILPVRAESLGLPNEASASDGFTFWVESFSADAPIVVGREEDPIMRTPRLSYRATQPTLVVAPQSTTPLFALSSGETIPVQFDVQRVLSTPATQGLLLLHHQNDAGKNGAGKVQVVEIKSSRLQRLLLPIVRNQGD